MKSSSPKSRTSSLGEYINKLFKNINRGPQRILRLTLSSFNKSLKQKPPAFGTLLMGIKFDRTMVSKLLTPNDYKRVWKCHARRQEKREGVPRPWKPITIPSITFGTLPTHHLCPRKKNSLILEKITIIFNKSLMEELRDSSSTHFWESHLGL